MTSAVTGKTQDIAGAHKLLAEHTSCSIMCLNTFCAQKLFCSTKFVLKNLLAPDRQAITLAILLNVLTGRPSLWPDY
jgi:hypothetical protein